MCESAFVGLNDLVIRVTLELDFSPISGSEAQDFCKFSCIFCETGLALFTEHPPYLRPLFSHSNLSVNILENLSVCPRPARWSVPVCYRELVR